MRRISALCAAVALLALPSMVKAQSYVWFGGGPSIPIGDSKDALKSGFIGSGGVGFGFGKKGDLSLQLEALYASHNYKLGSGSTSLIGGLANIACDINAAAKLHPYVYAGGGLLSAKPEGGSSDSKAAFQAGAGLSYKLNPKWNLWGDVRYLSTTGDSKFTLLPVTIGLSWSLRD